MNQSEPARTGEQLVAAQALTQLATPNRSNLKRPPGSSQPGAEDEDAVPAELPEEEEGQQDEPGETPKESMEKETPPETKVQHWSRITKNWERGVSSWAQQKTLQHMCRVLAGQLRWGFTMPSQEASVPPNAARLMGCGYSESAFQGCASHQSSFTTIDLSHVDRQPEVR